MTATMNRFTSVHAISFVTCNMTHLADQRDSGTLTEPEDDLDRIGAGVAAVHDATPRPRVTLRGSDAPLLRERPSDYRREMYYTSQPMEWTDTALLESTFIAVDTENTLLWSSDWPHWDFDLPGRIMAIPFRSDHAERNILGGNARKVFAKKSFASTH